MQDENKTVRATDVPGIVVIDVPGGASAEEASRALNAPGDLYFLVQILPVNGGHRAYFKRYKQTPVNAKTARESAGDVVADATALSIVRANRDKPIRTIESLLTEAGIKRRRHWVSDQLTAIFAQDGREDEALRFLKDRLGWPDGELISELREYKIKRTVGWVRVKRKELANAVPGDK